MKIKVGQQSRSRETEASLMCIDALHLCSCCSAVDIPNESNTFFWIFLYASLLLQYVTLCDGNSPLLVTLKRQTVVEFAII